MMFWELNTTHIKFTFLGLVQGAEILHGTHSFHISSLSSFLIVDDVLSHSHYGKYLERSTDIFGLHNWGWVQLVSAG